MTRSKKTPKRTLMDQFEAPRIRPMPPLPHQGADYCRPAVDANGDRKLSQRKPFKSIRTFQG